MRKDWIGGAIAAAIGVAGLVGAAAAQPVPLEWNVREQVQGLFSRLEAGDVGSLGIVGDSISFRRDSYNWFLRDRFWADYGIGGDGYMAVGSGFSGFVDTNGPRDGLRITTSAGGVEIGPVNGDRSAWGVYTPDGLYSRVFDAGYVQLKIYGPYCRLHYLRQPGGGVMRLTLNNVVLLDAPTDGPLEHASVDFEAPGNPDALKTLRIASKDGKPVQVSGLDMRTGHGGFVYHRLARGGSGPSDFIRADNTQTAGILWDLSPDLLIVMLDWAGDGAYDTFVQDTEQLLDFYALAMPEVPIVLMTHHPFKESIHDEAVWLYEIAQERGLGFINLYDTFPGGFLQMQALGLLDDEVHFSPAGGKWFGDYVYELLRHDATCQPPIIDAEPGDLDVAEGDPASFTVLSANATAYQWRKDGEVIPGATQATHWINAAAPGDAGVYDCLVSNDCDATLSAAAMLTVTPGEDKAWWFRDGDGDGYGDAADAVFEADQPEGFVGADGDCDDGNPEVHPGAEEVFNGIDDNCDGSIDEGLGVWWFADGDGDGYGVEGDEVLNAEKPEGYAALAGDCDDADPAAHPGAEEVLNDIDDDCDGLVDEGFERWWYRDADGDGFGDNLDAEFTVRAPDGYAPEADDCDDSDPLIHPGAPERLNGLDDNCDGGIDDGFEQWWYRDADGDGFGVDAEAVFVVQQPEGYVGATGDCDDGNPVVHPGAEEALNGLDDDCDGGIDEGFEQWWYRDADGDGFGVEAEAVFVVQQPEGYAAQAGDCDDGDAGVNPAAVEVFDGIDNDCDGETDENVGFYYYRDADADGFGDAADSVLAGFPPEGYVADDTDCDDANAAVHPGASEVCDGLDNDCNGHVDDGAAPIITQDPRTRNARIGETVVFSVSDIGGASYQWRKNGKDIDGATGSSYEIAGVKRDDAGVYSVMVSSACGEAISKGATLRVVAPLGPVGPAGPK